MPDPADQNARAHAENAGQPQRRRRRDLRRADGELTDARTGTMPAVTPNTSSQPDAGQPVTRRTSWAEAYHDIAAGVFQIVGLRVPLTAIADHGNLPGL